MIEKITNQNQISRHKLAEKINEIIDYINQNNHEYTSIEEVVKARENHIADVSKKMQDRMIGCTTLDIPESYKADPYEKQRRWIGKLCKFWDDEDEGYVYEILIDIEDDGSDYPYKMTDVDSENWTMSYKHCEPVSEDLIYKGE